MGDYFQTAYERARARYSRDQWLRLDPRQLTEAIYREMRQMDAEFGLRSAVLRAPGRLNRRLRRRRPTTPGPQSGAGRPRPGVPKPAEADRRRAGPGSIHDTGGNTSFILVCWYARTGVAPARERPFRSARQKAVSCCQIPPCF